MTTLRRCWCVMRVAGMGVAFVLASISLAAQSPKPPTPPYQPYELSSEHLKQAGFHLPSYMPTVWDLTTYQSRLSARQELTMEWDSIPGLTGRRLKKEVEGIALAPNFVLMDRKQRNGGAGRSSLTMNDGMLVIVAIDSNGEVRGIRNDPDLRVSSGEGYSPGKGWERADMVVDGCG
jgi:hypothetical protein